jgi:enoyl-CoA hydratase/carnithine racemase
MSDAILLDKKDAIARIIFNDPERLNALSYEMGESLPKVVEQVRADSEIRCVIVTGAGRAFSAGGRLDIIEEKLKNRSDENREGMLKFYHSFLCLRDIEVPTIAFINGHAIGAGFCLTLACDFRIASERAKMGVNFTKLGLSVGMAGSWLLTKIAGLPVATDLLLTGRTMDASEALDLGLLHQVHPMKQAEEAVNALAFEISKNSPVAVRETKRVLLANLQAPLEEALKNEAKSQAVSFQTRDLLEGVAAIREKRDPIFKGR